VVKARSLIRPQGFVWEIVRAGTEETSIKQSSESFKTMEGACNDGSVVLELLRKRARLGRQQGRYGLHRRHRRMINRPVLSAYARAAPTLPNGPNQADASASDFAWASPYLPIEQKLHSPR
jgi:hypothetical protein